MQDLENRLVQLRTAAEIAQLAVSETNLDHLLRRSSRLILDRFGYNLVSIFLIDNSQKIAVLVETAGDAAIQELRRRGRIEVGSASIVGWVTQNNKPRVISDIDPEWGDQKLGFSELSRSEVCIPISFRGDVLGVLDVQSIQVDAFDQDAVAVLFMIANHIGSTVQNIRLYDSTQEVLRQTDLFYKANHQISKSNSVDEIITIVWGLLHQTGHPHLGLRIEANSVLVDIASMRIAAILPGSKSSLALLPEHLEGFLAQEQSFTFCEQSQYHGLPPALQKLIIQGEWASAAFFPIMQAKKLKALMILGSTESSKLSATDLQPFISFIELATMAVDKIDVIQTTQRRLTELQMINEIGQTIAVEVNLQNLYRIIHRQVESVMGKVNFLIATYDPDTNFIQVPYMNEGDEEKSLAPFPLGEGLTSILINSRQPLMIVSDTIQKAQELGAKVVGQPARSWMGTPLIVAGEVIGAMIVQDQEQEFRFDQDDLHLLVTLASQVGIAVRNARLLETTYQQSDRQRRLYEITNRIRSAVTMQEILITTADELRKALSVHQARIEVKIDQPDQEAVSGNE